MFNTIALCGDPFEKARFFSIKMVISFNNSSFIVLSIIQHIYITADLHKDTWSLRSAAVT